MRMAVNYMPHFEITSLSHYHSQGAVHPVPDEYVGELTVSTHSMGLEVRPRDAIEYDDTGFYFHSQSKYQENSLLVILESPHRLEYNASGEPVALMMGKTGALFFERFAQHLARSSLPIKVGFYNLIVCNAVQYQTSCGLQPIDRSLRDQNWLEIYQNHGGENDLKQRVFSLKPRYTINLCTGGRSPQGLRSLVSQSLDSYGLKKGKHYTEGAHPSSWYTVRDPEYRFIL